LNTNENVIVSASCASIVYRHWSMVRAEVCAKDVPKFTNGGTNDSATL